MCKQIMEDGRKPSDPKSAWNQTKKWLKNFPLLGPFISGMADVLPGDHGDLLGDVLAASTDSTLALQSATAQWENAYAKFLLKEMPVVAKAAQEMLSPEGYIPLVTKYTTMPLNHAATMLIAPTIGLVLCSLVLVWAV